MIFLKQGFGFRPGLLYTVGQPVLNLLAGDDFSMKHNTLILLFIFFSISLLIPVDRKSTTAWADNTLKFGIHVSGMGKMDPHFAAGSQDRAVADLLFNGLLRYVPGHAPKIELDLAEKMPEYKIINGKQHWTIHLKKSVRFHKGPLTPAYELTADDVVFSINKSKDKSRCAYSGEYKDFTTKKTGRYTVSIILAQPLSPTLFFPKITDYNGGFIVSRKAIEKMGYDAFKKHPVGTGPFVFHQLEKGRKIVLKAHNDYFRGKPALSGVSIFFIPKVKDREKAFFQGQLDVIAGSGAKGWLTGIRSRPDIKIDTHGVGEVAVVHLNINSGPLKDVRVRKAIAYGINRNAFLSDAEPELSGPVYSPVPQQFLPGGISRKDARILKLEYPYDPKKARQLLSEAGYPNGFSLNLVSSEKRVYKNYYRILKEQLARINIQCRVELLPHSQMHARIRSVPLPLVVYPAWRPNADAYLTRFFHSDSIIINGKKKDTNFSHYDRVDNLIESARIQSDPEIQESLWVQAQIKILSDMAAYPLMYTKQVHLCHPYVDYGHTVVSTMALYPQFTEKTSISR